MNCNSKLKPHKKSYIVSIESQDGGQGHGPGLFLPNISWIDILGEVGCMQVTGDENADTRCGFLEETKFCSFSLNDHLQFKRYNQMIATCPFLCL